MAEIIECSYSLFDEGRRYSGNHRKYLLENAREVCYSPETRERIKNRECVGYYGHGRRMIAKTIDIGETEVATMPDGSKTIVDNVPSNVTVAFEIDSNGIIKHKQEILETVPGQIVSKLNASRVGGFSWACPGTDGGRHKATIMTGFSGFDYVLRPGFSNNRGYLLESADSDKVLESVAAVVGSDRVAESLVENWRLDCQTADEEAIFEAQAQLGDLRARFDNLQAKFSKGQEVLAMVKSENIKLATDQDELKKNVRGILESLPFFVPDEVADLMFAGNFDRAKRLFEDARRFDTSQLPIGERKDATTLPRHGAEKEPPEYGTAAYGFGLEM